MLKWSDLVGLKCLQSCFWPADLIFSLCLSVLSVFLQFLGEMSVFLAAKSSRTHKLINKFGVFGAEQEVCCEFKLSDWWDQA